MAQLIGVLELLYTFGLYNIFQLLSEAADLVFCLLQVGFKGFDSAISVLKVDFGLFQQLFGILQSFRKLSVVCFAFFFLSCSSSFSRSARCRLVILASSLAL